MFKKKKAEDVKVGDYVAFRGGKFYPPSPGFYVEEVHVAEAVGLVDLIGVSETGHSHARIYGTHNMVTLEVPGPVTQVTLDKGAEGPVG